MGREEQGGRMGERVNARGKWREERGGGRRIDGGRDGWIGRWMDGWMDGLKD